MTETELPAVAGGSFEALKRANEHGAEYWSARDLQPLLGYSQWRRFEQAISRAIASCEQSGNAAENHFAGAGKMVSLGSASSREVPDFRLSRFRRIGGDLPERIPPAEHIKTVEKRLKEATPRLELDDRDAIGLLGEAKDEAEKV